MTLELSVRGQSISLSKDAIYRFGPESLLVDALKVEPELKTLELTHPSLTVDVLVWLEKLFATKDIPKPRPAGLIEAGRYLNMPLLEVLAVDARRLYLEDGFPETKG